METLGFFNKQMGNFFHIYISLSSQMRGEHTIDSEHFLGNRMSTAHSLHKKAFEMALDQSDWTNGSST